MEQHVDDVGDDLSSLQASTNELICLTRRQEDDDNLAFIEHMIAEAFHALPRLSAQEFDPISISAVPSATFAALSDESTVHVCELFGGDGVTSTLCSRRLGLSSGRNFNLTCGVNLLAPADITRLWAYLSDSRPDVVIMAPPCTGFGPWMYLNRIIHPDAVARALRTGIPLANLAAEVARWQLQHGRHFVVEQPRNSTMFSLEKWQALLPSCVVGHCDQCRFGLKDQHGVPLMKPTTFLASHPLLLHRVAARHCKGSHSHGKVTSDAQRWPVQLCHALAVGVLDLVCMEKSKGKCVSSFPTFLPTFDCPGCRGHMRKDDSRHTRSHDCKFKDVEAVEWSCRGCRSNLHRADARHSLGPDCRWAIARTMPEGASRVRTGHHPRDPSIKAASEPTGSLKLAPDIASVLPAPKGKGASLRAHTEGEKASASTGAHIPSSKRAVQGDAHRVTKRSMEVQAGMPAGSASAQQDADAPAAEIADSVASGGPDWTRFDLGTSLQLLRSVRPAVVRRTLRQLHIRWYHASAKRMTMLLTAAGVSPEATALVGDIVSTCGICRAWNRPGPRSVVSTRLPDKFNQEIECDLLFVGSHVVLHVIDRCIRWSAAIKIADRSTDSLLRGLQTCWFGPFGPPVELISDQEGGLNEEAGARLQARQCKLTLRARGQHVGIDLLRRQIHLMDSDATNHGLRVDFEQILSEAVFAKNILLTYGGWSPYEALYGRTPALLDVSTADEGDEFSNPSRLRSIALQAITQATAQSRAQVALNSKTRPAGELQGLAVNDLVEIYRPAVSKDVSRWHGPATVVDVTSIIDGVVGVRWQGRNLLVRVQDCRRALSFTVIPVYFGRNAAAPIEILRAAAETIEGAALRLGWIRHKLAGGSHVKQTSISVRHCKPVCMSPP